MAEYVSRDVAVERLRKACKTGTILSVILLLAGLLYAGIAAIIYMNFKLPDIIWSIIYVLVPTMSNTTIAFADCATKSLLFLLISIIGLLMLRKISKTGDAFRAGQLKQLRFIGLMFFLLGFLPTLVGNAVAVAAAIRKGAAPMTVMSFNVNGLCIIAGLAMFCVARVLVAGAVVQSQPAQAESIPQTTNVSEPTYTSTPDLTHLPSVEPTTQETTVLSDYTPAEAVVDSVDLTTEQSVE